MDLKKEGQPQSRPKSPKSQKGSSLSSMASHVSGNNNVPHPPSTPNNNNITATVPTSGSRSKSPTANRSLTPQERSKLARDKFQSLLLSANKVQAHQTLPPGSYGIGMKPSSTLGTTAQMHAAAVLAQMSANVAAATGAISLVSANNASSSSSPPPPVPISQQQVTSTTHGGHIQTSVVAPVANTVRATTLATSAKTRNNPNQFPNIDPRTFPKPLNPTNPNPVIVKQPNMAKSVMGLDRSKNMRAFVEKAIAEHKVFSCVGVYPAIKNALKKRGWVEKTGPINVIRSASVPFRPEPSGTDDESDAAWIARNLRDYPPDFIWVIRRDNIDWKSMGKDQMINRYPKAWFTTKVGLSACLQQIHWFSEAGFSETFFPRCYRLCMDDERAAFQDDYRLTACMSYCRYFVENYESKGAAWLIDPQSRITPLSIDFASRQLGNYIRMRRHEDIDWLLPPNFMSQHWEAFIHQYVMVVHEKKKIRFESLEGVKMKYDIAKKTLQRIAQYWPQADLDGVYNMWICKPGARSRGKGIVIMNSLEKVLDLLNHGNSREANWVVQKYMERPMLVYKTKFDIRQWFVITDWTPLTVWFYKESYIRFCTKPFVLEDFHESIHLCNNAIQCRYQNAESRDAALPDENMWDNYTFQAYLKTIGKMDQWTKIYAGMKQAIIGVLLASQETIESRKGCFELYGADFMLSEDFTPWLIEINSCPCMASTTSITARMCAQCLEDTIKVVVDRRLNRNADTGMFEMVYRQPLSAVTVQQFTGHDLVIHGKKLTRDIDWPGTLSTKSSQIRRTSFITNSVLGKSPPNVISPQENLTFSDLLQKLRMKNTQLFQGYVTNTQAQTLAAVAGETADRSLTGTLLSKMRALSKVKQDMGGATEMNEIIPGMKKVYPKPTVSKAIKEGPEGTLSHLSKYFEENSSTFANLVRIGKEISDEEKHGIETSDAAGTSSPNKLRPGTFGPNLRRPSIIAAGNPYLPRPETAKTLEEVRLAVNAASNKYGKSVTPIDNGQNSDNYYDDVTTTNNDPVLLDSTSSSSDLIIPSSSPSDSWIDSSEADVIVSGQEEVKEKFETISECHQGPISMTSDPSPLNPDTATSLDLSTNNADLSTPLNKPDHLLIDLKLEGNFHFQDILNNNLGFPSSTSQSDSSDDSDESNFTPTSILNPASLLLSPSRSCSSGDNGTLKSRSTPFRRPSLANCKLRPATSNKGVRGRGGNKFPCHRIALRPSSSATRKSSLPTFPVSKINLKLV